MARRLLLDTRRLDPVRALRVARPAATGGAVPPGALLAVVLNVTAVDVTTSSHLTVWPSGAARPTASSLNFAAGATVAKREVVVGVGVGGVVAIGNRAGSVHVVVDVVGWYR